MIFSRRAILALMPAFLLSVHPGCMNGIRVADVTGTVSSKGKPKKDVWVRFAPVEGGRPAEGRSNAEGRYSLDYSRGREGAPVGKHRVMAWTGGDIDAEGNETTPRKLVFKGEFEVKSGDNSIDIAIP